MRQTTLLLVAAGPAAALPVCETSWAASYGNLEEVLKPALPADGTTGEREGEGVYSKKEYACAACVKLMVESKSCDVIPARKCYAYDVMGHFGTKTVEKVTDGKLGTATIEDTTDENWTYAMEGDSGALPDGSLECAPVLFLAANPGATKQVVDASCASGNPLCEDHPNKFQQCCAGMVPADMLCATGKFCCGEEESITIGKDKKAECASMSSEELEASKAATAAQHQAEEEAAATEEPTTATVMTTVGPVENLSPLQKLKAKAKGAVSGAKQKVAAAANKAKSAVKNVMGRFRRR